MPHYCAAIVDGRLLGCGHSLGNGDHSDPAAATTSPASSVTRHRRPSARPRRWRRLLQAVHSATTTASSTLTAARIGQMNQVTLLQFFVIMSLPAHTSMHQLKQARQEIKDVACPARSRQTRSLSLPLTTTVFINISFHLFCFLLVAIR